MRWKTRLAGMALPLVVCSVQAVPVVATPLVPGSSVTGAVDADTGPWAPADGWQFWTFDAKFGDEVSVTVQRLTSELDPVIGVWFGTEADTDAYFDMTSDSVASTWMGFGDDELPAFVAGPGGDAQVKFTSYLTGTFTIAVADHSFTPGGGPDMGYSLAVSVPEPGTYALMACGLAAFGLMRRRRAA